MQRNIDARNKQSYRRPSQSDSLESCSPSSLYTSPRRPSSPHSSRSRTSKRIDNTVKTKVIDDHRSLKSSEDDQHKISINSSISDRTLESDICPNYSSTRGDHRHHEEAMKKRRTNRDRSQSKERRHHYSDRESVEENGDSDYHKERRYRDRHHNRNDCRFDDHRSRNHHYRSSRYHDEDEHKHRRRSRSRSVDRYKLKEETMQRLMQLSSDGQLDLTKIPMADIMKTIVVPREYRNNQQMSMKYQMSQLTQRIEQLTGVKIPSFYCTGAVNPLIYAEQMRKRKLLWSGKNKESTSTAKVGLAMTEGQDKKTAEKFRKLLGIRDQESIQSQQCDSNEIIQRQAETFQAFDREYELARLATHTHRGTGLGFLSATPSTTTTTISNSNNSSNNATNTHYTNTTNRYGTLNSSNVSFKPLNSNFHGSKERS